MPTLTGAGLHIPAGPPYGVPAGPPFGAPGPFAGAVHDAPGPSLGSASLAFSQLRSACPAGAGAMLAVSCLCSRAL